MLGISTAPSAAPSTASSTAPSTAPSTSVSVTTSDYTRMLPTALAQTTCSYLEFSDTFRLAQTSAWHYREVKELIRQCLKTEGRVGDPVQAFQIPSNRLDRYVPIDHRGRDYLFGLGIKHPYMFEKIRTGQYSIAQAQQIIQSNVAKIRERKGLHGIVGLLMRTKDCGPTVALVESGLLTVDEFLNLTQEGHKALLYAGVVKLLDKGAIKMEQLNLMDEWSAQLLTDCSAITNALSRGALTLEQILQARCPTYHLTYRYDIRHYLGEGLMSLAQANQLFPQDCAFLAEPSVKRLLKQGRMSASQLLQLSSEERRVLLKQPHGLPAPFR